MLLAFVVVPLAQVASHARIARQGATQDLRDTNMIEASV